MARLQYRAAPSSCGRTPRIGRIAPSSESSPSTSTSSRHPSGSLSNAPSAASAIATSSAAPLLRKSAGARLTVMAYASSSTPRRASALATRTRASRTAASARPTIWKCDGPRWQQTSTRIGCASSPTSALACAVASPSGLPWIVALLLEVATMPGRQCTRRAARKCAGLHDRGAGEDRRPAAIADLRRSGWDAGAARYPAELCSCRTTPSCDRAHFAPGTPGLRGGIR